MLPPSYDIYFAGELFDHKHLIGNAMLAARIERLSAGRYRCRLPQDMEQTGAGAMDIRDQDLAAVAACDLALFNFDGPDLDSGTVVEFIYAKALDIPAALLRTDFRGGGDQQSESDAWNLMASFYPRARSVAIDAMAWYQEERRRDPASSADAALDRYCARIAAAAIDALDSARAEPPLLSGSPEDIERIYRWALQFPGGGLAARAAAADLSIPNLIAAKAEKGLIRIQ